MKRLFLSLILLGLSYFLLAQVNLEATGEGSTAELARQAAISELSYQISAQVKSRSESRQQLKNDQFEEATSQSVVIQSDLPLLGNRIEITSLPNTYRATARLESKAALPLYLTRIVELNQDLQSAKEDPLKWEIFSAMENLTNSGSGLYS